MKREHLAAGGAIGASILIASCCFAPTMFLLFGVSIDRSAGLVTVVADATIPDARLESAVEAAGRYRAEPIGATD